MSRASQQAPNIDCNNRSSYSNNGGELLHHICQGIGVRDDFLIGVGESNRVIQGHSDGTHTASDRQKYCDPYERNRRMNQAEREGQRNAQER